jgi:hypothetical protein
VDRTSPLISLQAPVLWTGLLHLSLYELLFHGQDFSTYLSTSSCSMDRTSPLISLQAPVPWTGLLHLSLYNLLFHGQDFSTYLSTRAYNAYTHLELNTFYHFFDEAFST